MDRKNVFWQSFNYSGDILFYLAYKFEEKSESGETDLLKERAL